MVYPKIILLVSLLVVAAAIPASESEELYRLPTTVTISKLELADLSINEFEQADERQAAVFSLKLNPRNLLQFTTKMRLLPPELNSDPDSVLLPQMFIAVGDDLYAGLGTRYLIEDGILIDDPQFSLRAGVDLEILPYIFLDVRADYRFDDWRELKEEEGFSTEDVVWGGALRIQF
jgi:hypothetical protein